MCNHIISHSLHSLDQAPWLVWETIGRLLEKAWELEISAKDIWGIFSEDLLAFLERSRDLRDVRYLKCLRHLCKYVCAAESIGGLP